MSGTTGIVLGLKNIRDEYVTFGRMKSKGETYPQAFKGSIVQQYKDFKLANDTLNPLGRMFTKGEKLHTAVANSARECGKLVGYAVTRH